MAPKTVLITGCSKGGIGDALAQEFHRKGVHVFATARSLSKISHLKDMGITTFELDVTSPDSIRNAVSFIEKETEGRLDFLVNNAGMGLTMPLLDTSLDAMREVFELNVFAVLAITQAFAPSLIKAKGKVINIGSIVGKMAQPFAGVYNPSKAAANLLSETLRVELAPFGVQVITVITGVIRTPFFTKHGEISLPEGSLYTSLQAQINDSASGKEFQGVLMAPSAYSQGVVANALKNKSKLWYWRGGNTWLVWGFTTFLWHLFPDSVFSKSSGLTGLRKQNNIKA